ncbi:aldo keto reductase [Lichtheimia corymbifera JMRC:FSU:9682]|uniref:Aldo keto reductase n=1 Tax=Lichtheimia corymbifera JMRC:FSU:9682 TaxID=1263082 RepID=A0A068RK51_9FUNG|nr:aldo keto reductase [Lichtheimia corymbifera JMRC:FSU:9682]
MSFGNSDWSDWLLGEDEAMNLIKKAYDAGINFFDTADGYSSGKSEKILGKAIHKHGFARDRIVVATKVYFPVQRFVMTEQDRIAGADIVNQSGLSRKHIFDAVNASLQRLGLDYIDVYQIHRMDHNLYNLLYREEEREMIPYCIDQGVAQIPWSPLAMGVLCGKKRDTKRSEQSIAMMQFYMGGGERYAMTNDEIVDHVVTLAEKKGLKPAQVALAWLLSKSHVTAPIIGVTKEQHLQDAIDALTIELTEDDIKYLEEPYIPKPLLPFQ